MKKIISALSGIVGLAATAAVTPGEWNSNFQESLDYAEANNVPIVVVWGNTGCSHCADLHKVLNDDVIMDWAEEHPILMVSKYPTTKTADYAAAKEWIQSIEPKITAYPLVGVYWKKADGTVACKVSFVGRNGTMYAKTPAGKDHLADQFANSLDQLVGEYPPAPTGESSFVTKDTENDRLEAEEDTEVVFVPVKREKGDAKVVNVLKAKYPSAAVRTVSFTWEAGVTEMTVRLELLPAEFEAGERIKLTLADNDGITLDKSSITMVEDMENLPKNPHWVGEHTAKTLPYGEWTMDFDVAKEKVRTYGGKLVAMFGGPLWCPNCVVIEDDVFSTKEFKKWAKAEKLVLVHFDQGQASSPSTPAGTARGRLLTLTPSESSTNKGGTGASYLSRHGIDPNSAEVQNVIDRVTTLTEQWLAPETTAARLANPVVLLLNDEGTKVDARFQREGGSSEMDLDENMCRLKDLITLGGDDECKGYRTVTPLALADGGEDSVEYHVNSRKIAYRLTGLAEGEYVAASVVSADPDAQYVYATLVTASGTEIAAGRGYVAVKEPLTAAQASELYLMTTAYGATASEAQSTLYGKATSFSALVSVSAGEEEPEQKVAFKSLAKAELKALNEELFTKQTATVPLYESVNLGGKRLVGTLAVSVTTANKISAKFTGEKTVSFSGTWDAISLSSGLVTTTLAKKVSRVDYTLDLSMDARGGFEALLMADGERIGSGASAAGDVSSYAGSYTVTLVDQAGEAGTGNLTVKITMAGKATVKGIMPDGTSISVSAVVSPNLDGTATLPIYKASGKYEVSMALAVKPDAYETWGSEGDKYTVRSVTGCLATYNAVSFSVFGGYWESTTPLAICDDYKLSYVLDVVVGGETNDVVTATKTGFKVTKAVLQSLSFTRSTGAFSGKAKFYDDVLGKTVTATVKGVLLPGWIDCKCGGEPVVERPYGSGTVYYKSGRETVSMPIDLVAESAE